MGRQRKSAIGEIISGVIMISIPFFISGGGHWVGMHVGLSLWKWILVVMGTGSLIRGGTRLIDQWRRMRLSRPDSKQRKINMENKILRVAQRSGGQVSVAKAALQIDASIEETETMLNSLASRGHANVEVSEEGQVLYIFPDFLDRDKLNK